MSVPPDHHRWSFIDFSFVITKLYDFETFCFTVDGPVVFKKSGGLQTVIDVFCNAKDNKVKGLALFTLGHAVEKYGKSVNLVI